MGYYILRILKCVIIYMHVHVINYGKIYIFICIDHDIHVGQKNKEKVCSPMTIHPNILPTCIHVFISST